MMVCHSPHMTETMTTEVQETVLSPMVDGGSTIVGVQI